MHHGPIIKTAVAAIASFLIVAIPNAVAVSEQAALSTLGWIFAGIAYTHFFEYWCHRIPMHRGIPALSNVRRSHLGHHRIFNGKNFKTRRRRDLDYIAGRFWVFPLLLFSHYGLVRLVLPGAQVTLFLLGALGHYLLFEISHWLTHVDGNALDRAVTRIPWLSGVRERQIEHHRKHHERPHTAFNFNPPYLADRVAASMPPTETLPSPVIVVAQPIPAPRVVSRGRLRPIVQYASAALVAAAVIGGAAVAWKLRTGAQETTSKDSLLA